MDERIYFVLAMCAALATLTLLIFIGAALWPYLPEIGAVLYIAFVIAVACLLFELFSLVRHRHLNRVHERSQAAALALRAHLHSKVIEAANLAAYVPDDGHLYHLSAYEENAKIFPVKEEEVTAELAAEAKRLATNEHMSEAGIAGRLMINVYQVRKLLGKPRSSKKKTPTN